MEKTYKIAVVTDDGNTISQHFGRATKYMVVTIEDKKVRSKELRDKVGHRDFQNEGDHQHAGHNDPRGRGFGQQAGDRHHRMFETISDCQILLARGMGRGAYVGLQQFNIRPVVTDIPLIDAAVQAVLDGTIVDHTEKLH